MKKLLLILAILIGCNYEKHKPVIINKYYFTYLGYDLPKGLCRYFYNTGGIEQVEFMDSCNKYNIGDTIRGR